jgi:hypothetical protein
MKDSLEVPLCAICRQPLDLKMDRYADEHGKGVHETCFAKRITPNDRRIPRLYGKSDLIASHKVHGRSPR